MPDTVPMLTPNEVTFLSAIDEAPKEGTIPRGIAANILLAAAGVERGMTWEERSDLLRGGYRDFEMPDFDVPDFAWKIEFALTKHADLIKKERLRQRAIIRTIAMGMVAAAATFATGGASTATLIPALIAAGKNLIPLITGGTPATTDADGS